MLNKFLDKFKVGGSYNVSALAGGAKAYFALRLLEKGADIFIVEPDYDEALILEDNINALKQLFEQSFNADIVLIPDSDVSEINAGLGRIAAAPNKKNYRLIVVATRQSVKNELPSMDNFAEYTVNIRLNDEISREHIITKLVASGYNRVDFVENKGEFSSRGEVFDVWPPQLKNPCRVVFCGTQAESIKEFDVYTQRSGEAYAKIEILPLNSGGSGRLADYAVKYLKEPVFVGSGEDSEYSKFFGTKILYEGLETFQGEPLGFGGIESFNRDMERFARQLAGWSAEGYKCLIFSHTIGEEERLKEIIYARDGSLESYPRWHMGALVKGFVNESEKLCVISNGEIFNRFQKSVRPFSYSGGRKIDALTQLEIGDYVVHHSYGIGKYLGLKNIESLGSQGEYITIEYKNQDKLYVPVEDFKQIQKYVGVEGRRPRVYSLDGTAWQKAKLKVKKGVEEIAMELLKTAASRASKQGFKFGEDSYIEKEFEHQFPYQETPDQARSIVEIKNDMMSAKPMDRLLCGDVGYGKTEVAMRAGLKAAMSSKQVAILAPTTILAEQHFETFGERLADFPVKIGMLSRFVPKHEQKKVVKKLADGELDIVVGTHRLLQKDLKFADLGLLIIDEEHRFGVKDKEKIKKIRENVDVLTMTATPIPRTLYMSIAGVKELSVIETPPEGRQPIISHVGKFNEDMIKKAFYLELNRGGQVFYVHNRIETIKSRVDYLRVILPGVRFGYIHGRMNALQIEETMYHFLKGDYDCLIATSIIESGLDIPRVNTLIVENAHNLGLAQLYQLRGRVGRSKAQAYCYLFYSEKTDMSDEARKRLEALKEFTSLGSGFKLALRDLEIRGAGNIIGREQHGFVNEVGFDLYAEMLKEEIDKLKGTAQKSDQEKQPEVEFQVSVNAFFPAEYIPVDTERILYYKKLHSLKKKQELEVLADELTDRFGSLPEEAKKLFEVVELKLLCRQIGVKSVIQQGSELQLGILQENRLDINKILSLAGRFPEDIVFKDKKDFIIFKYGGFFSADSPLGKIKDFLNSLL